MKAKILKDAKQTRNELAFAFFGILLVMCLAFYVDKTEDVGTHTGMMTLILPFLVSQWRYCNKLEKE